MALPLLPKTDDELAAILALATKFNLPASTVEPELAQIHNCTAPVSPAQAAAAVDAALAFFTPIRNEPEGGRRVVTPTVTPAKAQQPPPGVPELAFESAAKPAAKKRATSSKLRPKKARKTVKKQAATGASCSLPTARDPADPSFVATLSTPEDLAHLNPAHALVRRDVLAVRRAKSGRVFLQCVCCSHLPPKERANLSTMAPQRVETLYRTMVRFMMKHVKYCEHIPESVREAHMSMKTKKGASEKGMKVYWEESARAAGLCNGPDGRSIVYCAPAAPAFRVVG